MLFNSVVFFLFFASFYILYWGLPHKFRKFVLISGGAIFYGYASVPYLIHFILITIINYLLYQAVRNYQSKLLIIFTVSLNVLNLGFFKYFYFFNKLLFSISGSPIFQEIPKSFHLIFPLAISFYTFQMIALQVDAYRGKISKLLSLSDFMVFFLF